MTHTIAEKTPEDLRPKLIVWDLTPANDGSVNGSVPLDRHECLHVLDSIARTSRPIIVVKGPSVIRRDNIREIIDYGFTLGLKMVIELQPEELTPEVIENYRNYGVRIFRLILDGRIAEGADARFRHSPQFLALEKAVELLREKGFEVHFSVTLDNPDRRSFSFYLDYAFQKGARGLYCHLCFLKIPGSESRIHQHSAALDDFLLYIPDMKERVPSNMYLSPQCVRYTISTNNECGLVKPSEGNALQWKPTCLGGRTFGFLDACGRLYLCQGSGLAAGDLRSSGYDFKSLWYRSEVFCEVRSRCISCSETRTRIEEFQKHKKFKQLVIQENVRNLS